jgi:hypothetical protein
MTPADRRDFTVKDRDGKEHSYSCLPHKYEEGMAILLEVADALGGAFKGAVQAMLGTTTADKQDEFDVASIADSISTIPQRLLKQGGAKLFARILAHTRRDGDDLSKGHVRDFAYAANYGELFIAVGRVLEINFSPFGSDGMSDLRGLWSRVTQQLDVMSETQSETG